MWITNLHILYEMLELESTKINKNYMNKIYQARLLNKYYPKKDDTVEAIALLTIGLLMVGVVFF